MTATRPTSSTSRLFRVWLPTASAWAGVALAPAHGAFVGGAALSLGALSETAMLAVAARGLAATPAAGDDGDRRLAGRHAQLSSARLLSMAPQLLTTLWVARSAQAAASLVVWPALYELTALFSSPTGDWESVAAAALRRDRGDPGPRRLTAWLAVGAAGAFAVVVLGGLGQVFLRTLIAVPAEPAALGLRWAPLLLPVPALWLLRGYLRAWLMADDATGLLVWAGGAHVAALTAVGAALAAGSLPGVAVASLAILAGLLADLAVTGRGAPRRRRPGGREALLAP